MEWLVCAHTDTTTRLSAQPLLHLYWWALSQRARPLLLHTTALSRMSTFYEPFLPAAIQMPFQPTRADKSKP